METTVNNGMCRCCASEGAFKDVKSTYHWMGEEEIYSDMLQECFDIHLKVSEHGEDGGICEVCITQLRNAINFKKQVLHTEEQFKKHLQNKTLFRPNIVKVEVEGEDDSDDNMGSGDEGFSGAEFEVPIKTEDDEPKPKRRATAKAMSTRATSATTRAKKAKVDDGETSTKQTQDTRIGDRKKNVEDTPKRNRNNKGVTVTEIGNVRKRKLGELIYQLTNVEEILKCSNATPFNGQFYLGYMCCYCSTAYPDPADLKKHTLDTHKGLRNPAAQLLKQRNEDFSVKLDITGLQCTLCDTEEETLENMMKHLKDDHERNINTEIYNQILPFKFDSETLKCCMCPSVFTKFKSLLEHMHIHYRNFICKECDMGYVNQGCLNRHVISHKIGDFKCSFCPKTFNTRRNVKYHEKAVHILKHMVNKCGFCNEKFKSNLKKNDHLAEVHGVKMETVKCHACDTIFKNKDALTVHTKRHHLLERRHECSQCDMKFFASDELKRHMVKHTGVKEYICAICLKSYARQSRLKEHMRIHSGDMRFKCEHCGEEFVQKSSWKSHMKSRHGELV